MVSLLIREDGKTNKKCRITSSPELKEYQLVTMQWGFPKGSRYATAFSEKKFNYFVHIKNIQYSEI